jgi:hypothetical protein
MMECLLGQINVWVESTFKTEERRRREEVGRNMAEEGGF